VLLLLLIVLLLFHYCTYCTGAIAFDDAVAEVVAESFKDINTRAFWVLVIDALHTAMLGRFKPEALGLAVTGSYEKWRIVFFGSASRPPGSARQCIERTVAKPQLGALVGLHVHGSG
jgi:hypothetical protein